jgi:sensor domain CHASE-containing protein
MINTKKPDKKEMNSYAGVWKLSLRLKLTIIFVGIAALAVTITAFATFQRSQQALETEAFRKLTAIREMKANQIEYYFRLIEGQIRLLAEDDSVGSALLQFQKGAEDLAKAMSDEKSIIEGFRAYYEDDFISRKPT